MTETFWEETICSKFPRSLLLPLIVESAKNPGHTLGEFLRELTTHVLAHVGADEQLKRTEASQLTQVNDQRFALNWQQNGSGYMNFSNQGSKCRICDEIGHTSIRCPKDQKTIKDLVIGKRMCLNCLSSAHIASQCPHDGCRLCGHRHYVAMCPKRNRSADQQSQQRPAQRVFQATRQPYRQNANQNTNQNRPALQRQSQGTFGAHPITDEEEFSQNSVFDLTNVDNKGAILMTVEGQVYNKNTGHFEKLLFFIDPGAQLSLCQQDIAFKFGLIEGDPEKKILTGLGANVSEVQSYRARLQIKTEKQNELHVLMRTVPTITANFKAANLSEADKQFLSDYGIQLSNPNVSGEIQLPGILIGMDLFRYIMQFENTLVLPSGYHVSKTLLGPTVYGSRETNNGDADLAKTPPATSATPFVGVGFLEEGKSEKEMLEELFTLNSEETRDITDNNYFEQYRKHLDFRDNVITAPFPLKENITELEDNYGLAVRRLENLMKQLDNLPNVKNWYSYLMQQYEEEGVIEQITFDNCKSVGTYYMPHRGVWRAEKTTPLRIVFDASAKRVGQLSLNDVIFKGECFINKISDIILSTRFTPIMTLCDIQAAFTQIRIEDSHRDLCRFLWVKDLNKPVVRGNITKFRFRRLPFGVNASPAILSSALIEFLTRENTPLAQEIMKGLYVDNIFFGAETPEEATDKYHEIKLLFQRISMNVREFVSSSPLVNLVFPTEDRGKLGETKVLGVNYNSDKDSYSVTISFPQKQIRTKKDALSQLHSIYDPTGSTAPALIKLKLLMREMFELNEGWNDSLPSTIVEEWKQQTKAIEGTVLEYHRFVKTEPIESQGTLWVFADASTEALATCMYYQSAAGCPTSTILSGKSKLTPKKRKMTIPHLELTAIEMALKGCDSVQKVIGKEKLKTMNILSDSTIALAWLSTQHSAPPHVNKLLARIRKLITKLESQNSQIQFFHVVSEHNIADIGTRGAAGAVLANSEWLSGPKWVTKDAKEWPVRPVDSLPPSDTIEPEPIEMLPAVLSATVTEVPETLINLERFSSFSKVLRTFVCLVKGLRRWAERAKSRVNSESELTFLSQFKKDDSVSAQEMKIAEIFIIKEQQKCLNMTELQIRFPKFRPLLDENGIIRLNSRLLNADLPRDTQQPMFIPANSPLTGLLLDQLHKDHAHCGKNHMSALLRQRFYIPHAMACIKKRVARCIPCKRQHGLPMGAPDMPALPFDRVTISKPFQFTGVDYLGPFVGKSGMNMYVSLFTCLTTRALHLETVENETTGEFLKCLIRFVARRGVPELLRSDNGSQFKLAEKMLRSHETPEMLAENCVSTFCAEKGIKWTFNTAKAPWKGGAWERLVGSVKSAFKKSIGRKKLTFSEFTTTVTLIEGILNTRPLTSIDPNDLTKQPLRPVDFLNGNFKYGLSDFGQGENIDPDYEPNLIQTVEQAKAAIQSSETITKKFWEIWLKEYLPSLKNIHQFELKQPRHQRYKVPEINEVVIVYEDLIPRGFWKLAKIEDIIYSNDGFVRAVNLRFASGMRSTRPLNKIYPLEIRSVGSNCGQNDTVQNTDHNDPVLQPAQGNQRREQHPRAAKSRARETMQNLARHADPENHDESNVLVGTERRLEQHIDTGGGFRMPQVLKFETLVLIFMALSFPMVSGKFVCDNGTVSVYPHEKAIQLCFGERCSLQNPSEYITHYQIPVNPHDEDVTVTLKIGNVKQTRMCVPAAFCDKATPFLSKSLLGNPHCNPHKAIYSSAILCLIAVTLITIFVTSVVFVIKRKICHTSAENSDLEMQSEPEPDECQLSVATAMKHFRPLRLSNQNVTVTLFALIALTSACQKGYTRTNTEVICDETGKCHHEYYQELLVNPLTKEICLQLMHEGSLVGTLNITHVETQLVCEKQSMFYTRDSDPNIFTKFRCRGMGSCSIFGFSCPKVKTTDVFPELEAGSSYPGFTHCSYQDSLWCATGKTGCLFHRVAHVPQSELTYEIFKCSSWNPSSVFAVNFGITEVSQNFRAHLRPYEELNINNISFKIISEYKMHKNVLDNTFAVSTNETLIMPINWNYGVMCLSSEDAENITKCQPGFDCPCNFDSGGENCDCPQSNFRFVRQYKENVVPLETPQLQLTERNGTIISKTFEGEIVLSITVSNVSSIATKIIRQNCSVSADKLTGCYNCLSGARTQISCKTPIPAKIVVDCGTEAVVLSCSPKNVSNEMVFHFSGAIVNQTCEAKCGNFTKFELLGTLAYHPQVIPPHFTPNGTNPYSPWDWFDRLHMPDLEALFKTFLNHWKLAIGALSVLLILIGLTVTLGPIIIVKILEFILSIIETVATGGLHLFLSLIGTFTTWIHSQLQNM